MTSDAGQSERFLRRTLRQVAASGGLAEAKNVRLIHGSLMSLARSVQVPAADQLHAWARDEGVSETDAWRVEGIALAVEDGERNVGILRPATPEERGGVLLTSDELAVTRSALFLVLHGPICNVWSHPGGGDPPSMLHTMTGHWRQDYERLMAAIDVLRSGREPNGQVRLLGADEALKLIDAARRRRVPVLGVEGFTVDAHGSTPDMDAILDLSKVDDVDRSAELAADFLRHAPGHLKFDIVI